MKTINDLRSKEFRPETVLLTGGSGYLGTLIAAKLLSSGVENIVIPLRASSSIDNFLFRLNNELSAFGESLESVYGNVKIIPWNGSSDIGDDDFEEALTSYEIDEIVHCAGCLDYFNEADLDVVNIQLTKWMLSIGKRLRVRRFTFISTAYSSGYISGDVKEILHDDPEKDPTSYTSSKRKAEWLVAQSGLPYLILRPSILIGDWESGRYSGKRYGLYQQWMGLARLMTDRYHSDMHTVAPNQPLNLIHQDMFQESFLYAHRWLPDASICNLVSDNNSSPSMRNLWEMWIKIVRPHRVHYYSKFEDVDLKSIDIRQRAYLTFAQVNLKIGTHQWNFCREWMGPLSEKGLVFYNGTGDSVERCQNLFIENSKEMALYKEKFSKEFPKNNIKEINHYEIEPAI